MANQENSNTSINVNPEMKISFVSAEDIKKYQAQGYRHMMAKFPSDEDMPDLTGAERKVLRVFMAGKSPKVIAQILRIQDSSVNRLLSSIRKKFDCLCNAELMLKVQYIGISMLLP